MKSARRRVALYWLLLILPAVGVGAGTLWLLQREQARLDEQAAVANAARVEAVRERARLIAENMEVLLADVQNLLATTLRDTVPGAEREDLEGLPASNPLVGDVFATRPTGVIRWGAAREPTREWLSARTWTQASKATVIDAPEALLQYSVQSEVGGVQGNFAGFANARNTLQTEARQRAVKRSSAEMRDELPSAAAARADTAAPALRAEAMPEPAPRVVTWTTANEGSGLQVFAWLDGPDGGIVGLALDMPAVVARLQESMPADLPASERYALNGAAVVSRPAALAGASYETPTARVALSAALMPGWGIDGFWADRGQVTGDRWLGMGLGGMLVILLVAAILAGGGLLLRDARRSEIEAQQRTSFVAHVSHEFKTPLTTIRMYAELLGQGRVQGEAKQRDYLGVIGRETERLTRLVNNALDFGRLEQGAEKIALVERDVAAELRELVNAQTPRVAEAGLDLRSDLPEQPCVCRIDRDALHHIVLNLIDNACKYAADGGEITVRLQALPAGGGRVTVADRGSGVDPKDRARVFQQFERLDRALTAERPGGAGLGLSIARQLALRMGGNLSCESREGGGAEFILILS